MPHGGVTGEGEAGVVTKLMTRTPELLVGFDTETTGLDVRAERAISYGFSVYRYGQHVSTEQFYVVPDREISEGARRIHGLTRESIEAKRGVADVLGVAAGARRAVNQLQSFHAAGAYIVGANVARFDLAMLHWTLDSLQDGNEPRVDVVPLRVIDVIEHDLLMEPSRTIRPRRSLTNLCRYYGVAVGGHDAAADARAAVEVLLEQVVRNNAGQRELWAPPR